jgi:hypothetical protein
MSTQFMSDNLKGREHLGDLSIDRISALKWISRTLGMAEYNEFVWFIIRTGLKYL